MAVVPFADFRPDISDYRGAGLYSNNITNVVPRGDGYGPFNSLAAYSTALSSSCRGYFYARKSDGSVAIFAGTSTKLYKFNSTSTSTSALGFVDASQSSSAYSALSIDANWQFAQFNKYVFATQQNAPLQIYSLTSSTEFQDAAGSPPQAAYVTVVNRFLVLSGIINSATPTAYGIQWSGLNDVTSSSAWTSGVNSSDYQTFADGGLVRGVAGGEFGYIFQDASIRRMTFAPGSPYVFGIERIAQDDGLYAPYSLIGSGDRVFYISNDGFKMIVPGAYPEPIGKERVDRFFFADVDAGNLQLCIGVHDPAQTRVYWAYKSNSGASGAFDRVLCYDWVLKKWTLIEFSGEYMASLSAPGLTLEQIDAAYGTNIDTISLDSFDSIPVASRPSLSAFDDTHELAFFSGPNLEATLETGEQGADGQRIYVRDVTPVTDAVNLSVYVSRRSTPTSTTSYTTGSTPHADTGAAPIHVDTRFARAKVVITAATTWSYAAGVEPNIEVTGKR